jgi:hypothetical protein
MIKYLIGIISAAALCIFSLFALVTGESWYFENQLNVSPLTGVRQDAWLQNFSDNAFWHLLTALIFTIAWHSIGFGYYRIDNWSKAGGRLMWTGIFVAMLFVIAVISWPSTQATQDAGKLLAVLAYLFNAIFIYYISSVLASPTTVKYAPPGAIPIGRLWS